MIKIMTFLLVSVMVFLPLKATVYDFPGSPEYVENGGIQEGTMKTLTVSYLDLTFVVREWGKTAGQDPTVTTIGNRLGVTGGYIGNANAVSRSIEIKKTNNNSFTLNSMILYPYCYTPNNTPPYTYENAALSVKAYANSAEVGSWSLTTNAHLVPITLDFSQIANFDYTDIDKIVISAGLQDFQIDDLTMDAVTAPTITSATYNASTGALVVTGSNIEPNAGGMDIDASKFTITGQGGVTRALSTTSSVERTSATEFTLNITGADKTEVDKILNKNGLASVGGTAFNLAVSDDWCTNVSAGDISDATNAITVSNVTAPAISSTNPADAATLIPLNSSISVTFNIPINPTTLTAQTTNGAPSGSFQLSSDNFSTAIGMTSASPTMSNSNMTATFTPSAKLALNTTYKIRITTSATSANAIPLPLQYTSTSGFTTLNVLNPSSFTATVNSPEQIDLNWALNGNSDPVLVAYNTTNTFGNPTGTYTINSTIAGGGTVIYMGSNNSYNHLNLTPCTRYYYKIWSKDPSDNYSNGATDNEWTKPVVPDAPTVTNTISVNTLNVTVNSAENGSGAEYLIHETTTNKYLQTDGTLNSAEAWASAATWGTKTVTGLLANTQYTFEVKARNSNTTPDQSLYSQTTSKYTLANTPSAMRFVSNSVNGMDLQIDNVTNPANTQFAIFNGAQYLQSNGSFSNNEAWQTEAQWEISNSNLGVSNLSSGSTYNWQIKARNGDNIATDLSNALETKTLPDEASNVKFNNFTSNTFDISWTRGNGDGVKVFLKQIDEGAASPIDGTNYSADPAFADGSEIGSSGWYCIYSGQGTNVTVSNVSKMNLYMVHVVEYVSFSNHNYMYDIGATTSTALSVSAPTIQASNIQFSNISRTGMTVRWTRGNGEGSILLARESYKISNAPLSDGQVYLSHSGSFTDAANAAIGGAKALYNGSSLNPIVNVSDLNKYKLYYFRIIEYNNSASPYYYQETNSSNPASRWTLRRDGLAEEDLTIDAEFPYPNPVSSSITTTLDVFEAGNISAYLFDNSGKQIAELYNKYHEFGAYELKFDLSQIAQGAYQLVINKGREAIVYPISIIR
jgi:hypothetical protein